MIQHTTCFSRGTTYALERSFALERSIAVRSVYDGLGGRRGMRLKPSDEGKGALMERARRCGP